MLNQQNLSCPTCLSESSFLAEWQYSGLNESVFNYTANYYFCSNCGLVFSSNITDEQLRKFYALECLNRSSNVFRNFARIPLANISFFNRNI